MIDIVRYKSRRHNVLVQPATAQFASEANSLSVGVRKSDSHITLSRGKPKATNQPIEYPVGSDCPLSLLATWLIIFPVPSSFKPPVGVHFGFASDTAGAIDKLKAVCKHCYAVNKYTGGKINLVTHLRRHNLETWDQLVKTSASKFKSVFKSESELRWASPRGHPAVPGRPSLFGFLRMHDKTNIALAVPDTFDILLCHDNRNMLQLYIAFWEFKMILRWMIWI